jgi:hypothetical protein
MTVGLELLNHFFGKLWEREVWTKVRPRPIDNLCLFEPSSLILVKFFARVFHCGNLPGSDPRALHFTVFPEAMDGPQ